MNNTESSKKKRTLKQNKSLHKYCDMLADELNMAGYDMKKVLKPGIDIMWTPESVKNYLWRPVMHAMFDKISTTELETKDVTKVYETLNRHTASRFGISVVFPSEEEQMLENLKYKT